MKKQSILLIFVLGLLVMPLISAYSFGGWGSSYYYNSPLAFFDNEWVVFGIIFVVFFAIVFYTVNKSFKNPGVSAVIGAGIALFIAITLARRGLVDGYVGEALGSWMLIVAVLIGIGFLIKFIEESFGWIGVVIAVIGLWYVIHVIDPYELFPYVLLENDSFLSIFEFVASWFGLIIILVASFILLKVTGRKTGWERIMKGLNKPSYN